MARVLSVDAKKLLGRLRVLGAESPDGVVQDDTLWTAAGLKYEAYVSAAAELVKEDRRRALRAVQTSLP